MQPFDPLADLRGAVVHIARDRCASQPWLLEDAVQEGMIAAWEAWQHRPGNRDYAIGAARNNIKAIAMGTRSMTGSSRQGRAMEQTPAQWDPDLDDSRAMSYDDVEAEMAYHRREIAAVISELTERQRRVVADIAFGVPLTRTQSGEWSGRLRPRLAEKLSHLRETK